MLVQLKIEMERAMKGKLMLVSLFLGCVITVSHFFQYVYGKEIYDSITLFCPESVFYDWIGASSFPMQSYLYFLVFPIISVLPAGASFFDDIKSGYIKNIFIRTKKIHYLIAKYVAVFVSGGIVFLFPLLLNLILTSMCVPALLPEPINCIGPSLPSVGAELFYRHPWIYTAIYLLFDFIFAGGITTFALLCAYGSNHRITVLITPFIFYYFLYALNNIVSSQKFSPNYFLIPGYADNTILEFVFSIVGIILIFAVYLWKGMKDEML